MKQMKMQEFGGKMKSENGFLRGVFFP